MANGGSAAVNDYMSLNSLYLGRCDNDVIGCQDSIGMKNFRHFSRDGGFAHAGRTTEDKVANQIIGAATCMRKKRRHVNVRMMII